MAVPTPAEFITWTNDQIATRLSVMGYPMTGQRLGMQSFLENTSTWDDEATMDANSAALQDWFDTGQLDARVYLLLKGDFYAINTNLVGPTRTGIPVIYGQGGEPTYHPLTQYGPEEGAGGGTICALVWMDPTSLDGSMVSLPGHGWIWGAIHLMGKQSDDGTWLLQDAAFAQQPTTTPLTVHADENRKFCGMRCHSTRYDFGSGKGHFPLGLGTYFFEVGVLVDDDPDIVPNHNDQFDFGNRFAPQYCDVGFWCRQRQSFSNVFRQVECVSRWGFVRDAGGKLYIHHLNMQDYCSIGVFERGSDVASGTGPDENMIDYINIDDKVTVPSDAMFLKVDPVFTPTLQVRTDANTGTLRSTIRHAVHEGEVMQLSWTAGGGGYRSGMTVTAITDVTADGPWDIDIDGGSGDDLPATSTTITLLRYSASSYNIRNAHCNVARAIASGDGASLLSKTNCSYTSSTRVIQCDTTNLSGLAAGDFVWGRNDADTMVDFIGKVSSVNDGADTITLTTDVYLGSLPGDLTNDLSFEVYRASNQKPLFYFRNHYGIARVSNLRLAFGRMIHAQGCPANAPQHIIFDNVYFYGGKWPYNASAASSSSTSSLAAQLVALLYTSTSADWVAGEITMAYEEPSSTSHTGQRYQNFSWYGNLDGAGKFSTVDVKVW